MNDNWDNIILPKKEPALRKESLKAAKKITEYGTTVSPFFPELKKAVRLRSPQAVRQHSPQAVRSVASVAELSPSPQTETRTEKVLPIAPDTSPSPLSTHPPFGAISPYISKLPILWTKDFGNKLATFALALVISFGVYSYSGHILNLGFDRTVVATVSSIARVAGQTYDRFTFFLNIKNQKEQLASPSAPLGDELNVSSLKNGQATPIFRAETTTTPTNMSTSTDTSPSSF